MPCLSLSLGSELVYNVQYTYIHCITQNLIIHRAHVDVRMYMYVYVGLRSGVMYFVFTIIQCYVRHDKLILISCFLDPAGLILVFQWKKK